MESKEIYLFVYFFLVLITILLWFTFLNKYSLILYEKGVKITNNYVEEFISH